MQIKKLFFIFIPSAIYVLYAINHYKHLDEICKQSDGNSETGITSECVKPVLKNARLGDADSIFRYTGHLELIVDEELSQINPSYAQDESAGSLAKYTSPHKNEYLYWLDQSAKLGNSYFIRNTLSLCQVGVQSFDSTKIKNIMNTAKQSLNNQRNQAAIKEITELDQMLRRGDFLPCR